MQKFSGKDDNNKYLNWVRDHESDGYVFNDGHGTLHKADCRSVKEGNRYDPESSEKKKLRTSEVSSKTCFESKEEAESFLRDRKFSRCGICNP